MKLYRCTVAGLPVLFVKDSNKNCLTCSHSCKKLFSKKYRCTIILGLDLYDGVYGYCDMYEDK